MICKFFLTKVMSNRKTIQINPELFSISPRKKTNKSTTPKNLTPKAAPALKPNSLKKKLIQRVKEHKLKETKVDHINNIKSHENLNSDKYAEEFQDSINYLSGLSSQAKDPNKKSRVKNTTLKHYNTNEVNQASINFELPSDLKPVPPVPHVPENEPPIRLSTPTSVSSPVPYGCLKGGNKPTYKTWVRTQKNRSDEHSEALNMAPQVSSIINQPITNREQKLSDLKNRLKEEKTSETMFDKKQIVLPGLNLQDNSINTDEVYDNDIVESTNNFPKRFKKTIKKTFKLGKNNKSKSIGVLIKDRKTRKNVLDAHRELKRKNITDIKQHLRDHGIIKAGSKAPNDIMRKMYESCMLSGDVTNQDTDVLLHNFLQEDIK